MAKRYSLTNEASDHGAKPSSHRSSQPSSHREGQRRDSVITERLTKDVASAKIAMNRSPELVLLTQEYDKLRSQIKTMIDVLEQYQNACVAMTRAREEMYDHLATMSRNSPLFEHIGKPLIGSDMKSLQKAFSSADGNMLPYIENARIFKGRKGSEVLADLECSLNTLKQIDHHQAQSEIANYRRHILRYAIQWEEAITTRVEEELKQVKKLKAERKHYEHKMELLRKQMHGYEEKGKKPPSDFKEKYDRNEEKLKEAYELHETAAGRLCNLLEEVIIGGTANVLNSSVGPGNNSDKAPKSVRNDSAPKNAKSVATRSRGGWKDLFGLVKNIMTFEANRCRSEHDIYGVTLPTSIDSMKETLKKETTAVKKKSKKGRRKSIA